jgi:hypothetical protein
MRKKLLYGLLLGLASAFLALTLKLDWLEILVQGGKNESFSCNFFFPSVLVLELDVRISAVGRFLRCVIWERTLLKLDLVVRGMGC